MKRQGLQLSLLDVLDLLNEFRENNDFFNIVDSGIEINKKMLIPIINKDGLSDTWELE
jgi:hypothetical protein